MLPATKLEINCYAGMYQNCVKLWYAPLELPALTLPKYCYWSMFSGCTELRYILSEFSTESFCEYPCLRATQLNIGCYEDMFENCLKLEVIHYATEVQDNTVFKNIKDSPKFGATNATVYYDL